MKKDINLMIKYAELNSERIYLWIEQANELVNNGKGLELVEDTELPAKIMRFFQNKTVYQMLNLCELTLRHVKEGLKKSSEGII